MTVSKIYVTRHTLLLTWPVSGLFAELNTGEKMCLHTKSVVLDIEGRIWWLQKEREEIEKKSIYIYKTEMSVCSSSCFAVCPSRLGPAKGDVEGGQEGRGQWVGGISMMECQGGHTFPEQHRVTQLALFKVECMSLRHAPQLTWSCLVYLPSWTSRKWSVEQHPSHWFLLLLLAHQCLIVSPKWTLELLMEGYECSVCVDSEYIMCEVCVSV